ncbi:nuclear transport factor 2 family protein [Phenylobacterium sp. LjRoot225]|uniref:nuclear transport factor 2 family protein n=1 Tax=Phenylobacterium sp. LjRoot225 TaxID=3342285 RepID=UPI003ECFE3F1
MDLELPEPVETYFAAANTDDADLVAACFTETAFVHDDGQDIHGREAVRAWAAEARRKYRFHAEVLAAEVDAERTMVTAHLTGEFPGNPVDLHYRFRLADRKIAALEIG